jgi:hypothetical protein
MDAGGVMTTNYVDSWIMRTGDVDCIEEYGVHQSVCAFCGWHGPERDDPWGDGPSGFDVAMGDGDEHECAEHPDTPWVAGPTGFLPWPKESDYTGCTYLVGERCMESRDDSWGHHPAVWVYVVRCTKCTVENSSPWAEHAVIDAEAHDAHHNGGTLPIDFVTLRLLRAGFDFLQIQSLLHASLGVLLERKKRALADEKRRANVPVAFASVWAGQPAAVA